MERKLLWILCIVSIMTFASSLFSSLLIYFNENNHTRVNSSNIINTKTKYKKSLIVYETGKSVSIKDVAGLFEKDYWVSITNDNSDDIIYQIMWKNVTSDWNTTDNVNFVYGVSCDNGVVIDNNVMPNTNEEKVIVGAIVVSANKSVACGIKVRYAGNYLEQSNNSFSADLDVLINS